MLFRSHELKCFEENIPLLKRKNYDYIVKKNINNSSTDIYIGVLPWKLFKSYNIIKEKQHNYLNNYKDVIDETIEKIKIINSSDNIEETFDLLFPGSDIIKEKKFLKEECHISFLDNII